MGRGAIRRGASYLTMSGLASEAVVPGYRTLDQSPDTAPHVNTRQRVVLMPLSVLILLLLKPLRKQQQQ